MARTSRKSQYAEYVSKLIVQFEDCIQLVLGSVPHNVTESVLTEEMAAFGQVRHIRLLKKATNQGRLGLATLYLDARADGARALAHLNKTYIPTRNVGASGTRC